MLWLNWRMGDLEYRTKKIWGAKKFVGFVCAFPGVSVGMKVRRQKYNYTFLFYMCNYTNIIHKYFILYFLFIRYLIYI